MNVSGVAATPATAVAVQAKVSAPNADTDGARGNLSKTAMSTPAAAKAELATVIAAKAAKATTAARAAKVTAAAKAAKATAAGAAKAAQQTTAKTPASRSAATSLTGVGTRLDTQA